MIDWQPIPELPHQGAPFDGEEVLLFVEIASVEIVRLGRWNPGGKIDYSTGELFDLAPEDRGWWSYIHSVTQEQLTGMYQPTYWSPYSSPAGVR